jgi:hypothetical protein
MLGVQFEGQVGNAEVMITNGRGLNVDELTRLALNKIVYVGPGVPPAIRDQAEAYKAQVEIVLRHYLAQAQKSQNTTIFNVLEQAGETRAAQLVRSL